MPVTAIRSIRNSTPEGLGVANLENPSDTGGGKGSSLNVLPGQVIECNIWIPWADSYSDFLHGKWPLFRGPAHILILYAWASTQDPQDPPPNAFAVWQQGDYVRYTKNMQWSDNGPLVPGNSTVGGDRSLEVVGGTIWQSDLVFD